MGSRKQAKIHYFMMSTRTWCNAATLCGWMPSWSWSSVRHRDGHLPTSHARQNKVSLHRPFTPHPNCTARWLSFITMHHVSPFSDFLRPLVVSGPSGVGKGFLIKRLLVELPDKFGLCISRMRHSCYIHYVAADLLLLSDTTRDPRPGEVDGRDYYFTFPPTFQSLLQAGAFIEHAEFSGNMYGTTRKAVHDVTSTGRRCILEIEAQVRSPGLRNTFFLNWSTRTFSGHPSNQTDKFESRLSLPLAPFNDGSSGPLARAWNGNESNNTKAVSNGYKGDEICKKSWRTWCHIGAWKLREIIPRLSKSCLWRAHCWWRFACF